jgi:hypothetical protein
MASQNGRLMKAREWLLALSTCEGDVVGDGAVGTIQSGTTHALRAGAWDADAGGAIASATAVAAPDGEIDMLARSPDQAAAGPSRPSPVSWSPRAKVKFGKVK